MVVFRIEGTACPLAERSLSLALDLSRLGDPSAGRTARRVELEVLSTAETDALLRNGRSLHTAEPFNAESHAGELWADGTLLLRGEVHLLRVEGRGDVRRYHVELAGEADTWAEVAARRTIGELPVDFAGVLTPSAVVAGWSDQSAVKFFPVHRDGYAPDNASVGIAAPERILSVDDYYPFLSLRAMVGAIFSQAGYTLQSAFLDGEFFRSLYMSGAYARRDVQALRERMGFCALRSADGEAVADTNGRVDANPFAAHATVGNLVDCFTPGTDRPGVPLSQAYAANGCLAMEEGELCFRPLAEVSVGFEYRLRYVTDYRIRSRERLAGFDTVWLGEGCDVQMGLTNRFADRREEFEGEYEYRIVVFDHAAGASYSLRCDTPSAEGVEAAAFAARSALVTAPAGASAPRLYRRLAGEGAYAPYAGDWALYDGYVAETGRTEVEVTLRTPAERVTPTAPKYFHGIHFRGAEPGMRFTLREGTMLRPVFGGRPGYGEALAFADMAHGDVRQIELLEAVAHLFNLRFWTDEAMHRVYVEPEESFYRTSAVDWREKIDRESPFAFGDLAQEVHALRTWCYAAGDGPVRRAGEEGAEVGAWSAPCASQAALRGEQRLVNPLFAATVSGQGHYANAPSAWILEAGDRDDAATDEWENLSPRIVRYAGLHDLPEGERWGHPAPGGQYPLAAFDFAGDAQTAPFTLSFADGEGCQGLHRHYDAVVERQTLRQRLTIVLHVAPDEFAALEWADGGTHASLRSTFRLDAGGESSLYRLEAVESYDPRSGAAKCRFIRLMRD